jgi:predicted Zn-dependent peptidase
VLVVVGDFDPAATKGWIDRYFGSIAPREVPAKPDASEPSQEREKRAVMENRLAPRPAIAFGYHAPPRLTPAHFAMGLLNQMLVGGTDSRLHETLVKRLRLTESVSGGINLLGSMFDYRGPMLWAVSLRYDGDHTDEQIIAAFDSVIDDIRNRPVSPAELERARTQLRSDLYDVLLSGARTGLAGLLASFALFDDDPTLVNRIDTGFQQVTPELLQQTARESLRPENRTILTLKPAKPMADSGKTP